MPNIYSKPIIVNYEEEINYPDDEDEEYYYYLDYIEQMYD